MSQPDTANSAPKAETPMMRQWSALKALAGDSLLFFRLGDFYELFDSDARTAAPLLGIVLTSRNSKSPDATPLCGIPIHQFENYVGTLLDAGHSIALAEQTEAAAPGKALVRREIVQWLTPGIRFLPNDSRPHFAGCLISDQKKWSLAAADVATGQIVCVEGFGLDDLQETLDRFPVEDLRYFTDLPEGIRVKFSQPIQFTLTVDEISQIILNRLNLTSLEDAPTKSALGQKALGTLLKLLDDAHPRERLTYFSRLQDPTSVTLSAATRRNLHLFEPIEKNFFCLFDRTKTAFGRRELKEILSNPTQDIHLISSRQKVISFFKSNSFIRKKFRERLGESLDLHRLLRRSDSPRELIKLSDSLLSLSEASQLITDDRPELERFRNLANQLRPLIDQLHSSVQMSESEESGWIQKGVLPDLDQLRDLEANQNRLLSDLEESLRSETKISSLKIKFHQILGYVIETTAIHKEKIPPRARRVQSLANAERFKTTELESLEEKILSLATRIREAERAEIDRLSALVREQSSTILAFVASAATLDALQSLAEVSVELDWTTPESVHDGVCAEIEMATHPMISGFVPLSVRLNAAHLQVMLLTGPNMAGKSTLLRLISLIALLHQIGSDVPAKMARISIFDRIMCRMGAQDDLLSGQSTFFVEMKEVAQMLTGATERSLLLFDEIGRGTSTYDGMSLAWAIAEEVHRSHSLSLIATHYLELAELEKTCPRLKTFHLGVDERSGKLVFTRKLVAGAASRSYGIQVARLAHLSERILKRAEQKLGVLERKRTQGLPLFDRPES